MAGVGKGIRWLLLRRVSVLKLMVRGSGEYSGGSGLRRKRNAGSRGDVLMLDQWPKLSGEGRDLRKEIGMCFPGVRPSRRRGAAGQWGNVLFTDWGTKVCLVLLGHSCGTGGRTGERLKQFVRGQKDGIRGFHRGRRANTWGHEWRQKQRGTVGSAGEEPECFRLKSHHARIENALTVRVGERGQLVKIAGDRLGY